MPNLILDINAVTNETIEAAFYYSNFTHKPITISITKDQVSLTKGYLGLSSADLALRLQGLRTKYPDSQIELLRSACGGKDKSSTGEIFQLIENDIRYSLDGIHIDFSQRKAPRFETFQKELEAVKYARKLNPGIYIQLGQNKLDNLPLLKKELDSIPNQLMPKYYVLNTGSRISENFQAGIINFKNVQQAKQLLNDYNILLKEENAEFLSEEMIQQRKGLVDSIRLSTELALAQTNLILNLAQRYDIDCNNWIELAYNSKKWKKLIFETNADDSWNCGVLVAHEFMNSDPYQKIVKKLSNYENLNEIVVVELVKIIDKYGRQF